MAERTVEKPLAGKVSIVTGASRGIGKGIALQLGENGAIVYITGRTLNPDKESIVGGSLTETANEIRERGGTCIPVRCDHSKDVEVARLFEMVDKEQKGRLDILVNNAFAGVTALVKSIGKPFWECPLDMWEQVCDVGVRNHYICATHAARMMVPWKQGLIINVSSLGGKVYSFNAIYGIGKSAVDRMAQDCAKELKPHNICFLSLWPDLIRTELISHYASTGELDGLKEQINYDGQELMEMSASIEFTGKAIVHLAQEQNIMDRTGQIVSTSVVAKEHGFKDIDGKEIVAIEM